MKLQEFHTLIREELVKVLQEKTKDEINAEKAEIQAALKSANIQKKALDAKIKVLQNRLTSINSQKAEAPATTI